MGLPNLPWMLTASSVVSQRNLIPRQLHLVSTMGPVRAIGDRESFGLVERCMVVG
jgi:hypothetical protein